MDQSDRPPSKPYPLPFLPTATSGSDKALPKWHYLAPFCGTAFKQKQYRPDDHLRFHARQGLLTVAKIKHKLEFRLNRPIDLVPEASVQMSNN